MAGPPAVHHSPISLSRAGPLQLPGNSDNSDSPPGAFPAHSCMRLRKHGPHASCSRPVTWFQNAGNIGSMSAYAMYCAVLRLMPNKTRQNEQSQLGRVCSHRPKTTKLATPRTGGAGQGYSIQAYTNRISCDGVTHLLVSSVIGHGQVRASSSFSAKVPEAATITSRGGKTHAHELLRTS